MRIPNFKTDEGAILYKNTVGKFIAPEVAKTVIKLANKRIDAGTKRILDVACGPGTVTLALAKQYPGIEISGVDSSASMIHECIRSADELSLGNVRFTEMNANHIDFEDNHPFDLVVCNLAFPFFSRPLESMQGFLKVLADNGHVILSVPGRETWAEFFVIAEEILGDAIRMAKPFLLKMEQAAKLPKAMEDAGFQNVEISHHKLPFTFQTGEDVLAFFEELFSLLSYAPPEIQADIAGTINQRFPNGFTMHYQAMVVEASK